MPIYEFVCRVCGERFERVCRMGETGAGVECPACGKSGARKVPSTFAAAGSCSAPGGSGFG